MKQITVRGVVPQVFVGEPLDSQVWHRDITFTTPEFSLIEAESGAGKSSLCSFLYGYRKDYEGTILFDDADISHFTIEQWCRVRTHHLSLLPQELRIFPELTALENIQIKNKLTHFKSEAEIVAMLARLELDKKVHSPAGLLSRGQQQRVAIVRALCQPMNFLLLDEPVSHLDVRNNKMAATLIVDELAAQNASVIATSVGAVIDLPYNRTLKL